MNCMTWLVFGKKRRRKGSSCSQICVSRRESLIVPFVFARIMMFHDRNITPDRYRWALHGEKFIFTSFTRVQNARRYYGFSHQNIFLILEAPCSGLSLVFSRDCALFAVPSQQYLLGTVWVRFHNSKLWLASTSCNTLVRGFNGD